MLIIDMPMPSRCGECPLIYMEIVTCTITGKDCTEYGAERPSWCPIKGVLPDEHGDLIDRTLLFADMVGVILSHSGLNFSEVIARQNAVIAAERKDDTV